MKRKRGRIDVGSIEGSTIFDDESHSNDNKDNKISRFEKDRPAKEDTSNDISPEKRDYYHWTMMKENSCSKQEKLRYHVESRNILSNR